MQTVREFECQGHKIKLCESKRIDGAINRHVFVDGEANPQLKYIGSLEEWEQGVRNYITAYSRTPR